jgi:hypothetical protein
MTEVATIVLAAAWVSLVIMGLHPDLGARFGLWLRSRVEPAPPPEVTPPTEGETHVGKNLDRFV